VAWATITAVEGWVAAPRRVPVLEAWRDSWSQEDGGEDCAAEAASEVSDVVARRTLRSRGGGEGATDAADASGSRTALTVYVRRASARASTMTGSTTA